MVNPWHFIHILAQVTAVQQGRQIQLTAGGEAVTFSSSNNREVRTDIVAKDAKQHLARMSPRLPPVKSSTGGSNFSVACLVEQSAEGPLSKDHAKGSECIQSGECADECGQKVKAQARWCLGDPTLHLPKGTAIVEVGTNTGIDLKQFLLHFPDATVYSYEPNKDLWFFARKLLFLKLKRFRQRVVLMNKGVSDQMGSAELHVPKGHSEAASSFNVSDASMMFHTIRLQDALQQVETDHLTPKAISINCEGCEYAVMEDFVRSPYLGKVTHISLSWHSLVSIPQRHERRCAIENSLLKACYKRTYHSDWGWQGWQLGKECVAL